MYYRILWWTLYFLSFSFFFKRKLFGTYEIRGWPTPGKKKQGGAACVLFTWEKDSDKGPSVKRYIIRKTEREHDSVTDSNAGTVIYGESHKTATGASQTHVHGAENGELRLRLVGHFQNVNDNHSGMGIGKNHLTKLS